VEQPYPNNPRKFAYFDINKNRALAEAESTKQFRHFDTSNLLNHGFDIRSRGGPKKREQTLRASHSVEQIHNDVVIRADSKRAISPQP